MQQFLISVFAFVIFFGGLTAQQSNYCGTILGEEMEERLREQQRNPLKLRAADGDVYLPVQFHLVANDEGQGRYKNHRVIRLLCDLNAANTASNTGMQFYMYNDEIKYIDNSDYFIHDWDHGWEMMSEHYVYGAINIFIVLDPADVCGYFWGGPDCVAVANGCAAPGASTIVHELGHYFSLPHTFSGFENGDNNPSSNIENYAREGVDKNCQFAGDGFCDTYPDYIAERWGCEGTFLQDPKGIDFEVDGSLFMSYADDYCQTRFSQEQIDAMHANLVQYRQDLLEDDDELVLGDLTATNILYPAHQDSDVANNDVVFQWEAVENAEFYSVNISNFILGIEYDLFVSGNTFTLESLPPGTSFLWEVRPYNDGNFCAPVTDTQIFTTAENETLSPTNIQAQQVSCFGANDGSLTFEATGGQAPYEYLWEDGTAGPTIEGIGAGVYTVTVTDATGLTEDILLQLIEPSELTASFEAGVNNILEADIEGGVLPYTYLLDGVEFDQLPDELEGGNHSITVTDASGCSSIKFELGVLQIQTWGIDSPVCGDDSNANIALGNILGGAPPYQFAWSNGSTSQNLTSVTAGTYQVTITSADELEATYEFVIDNPGTLEANSSVFEDQVTIDVIGGVPPYNYYWPNGTDAALNEAVFPVGNYVMTISDSNGCSLLSNFSVTFSGVEEGDLQLQLFPNPIQAGDAIQLAGFDGSEHIVQLFDQAGRVVFEKTDRFSGSIELSADQLVQGIYLIRVSSDKGNWTRKLLVNPS